MAVLFYLGVTGICQYHFNIVLIDSLNKINIICCIIKHKKNI